MIVSIQSKQIAGPWGGGNQFSINLSNYLKSFGYTVIDHLFYNEIDIILMTDPLENSLSVNYSYQDIKNYKKYICQNTQIVHRINECDERKNTSGVNNQIKSTNKIAELSIFVSYWLKNLYELNDLRNNNIVIPAGSDKKIFNSTGRERWDKKTPVKFVTHHWGTDKNKGVEIYNLLDKLIGEKYKNKIEFTYIGNLPNSNKFVNTKHIKPLSGKTLGDELKKNHVYLTASLNEPSGNHHIEAAQCGLPILFIDSGGIPEYCNSFGVKFSGSNDFENSLNKIIDKYDYFFSKILDYPFESDKTNKAYEEVFLKLYQKIDHSKNIKKHSLYNFLYILNKFKFNLIY